MNFSDNIRHLDEYGPNVRAAFNYFCNHLVAINCNYVPINSRGEQIAEQNAFTFAGFVMSVCGQWVLVTAGHILRDFDQKKNKIRLGEGAIIDCFGDGESKEPIPFNLLDFNMVYEYGEGSHDGLDWGFIELNGNIEKLMKANHIVAVTEEQWRRFESVPAEKHFMIGLPTVLIDLTPKADGRLSYRMAPAMMAVTQIEGSERLPKTTYPRFLGQLPDHVDIDINGMSGGPILGYSPDRGFSIIAVQSRWLKKEKITVGCPLSVFAPRLAEELKKSQENNQ